MVLAVFLSLAFALTAQTPCGSFFSIGPDTTICAGSSVALAATPGFYGYLWNSGATTSSIVADTTGLYVCTALEYSTASNSVINGDFSAGATGFSSDYIPGTGGTYGILSLEGQYAVATNPHNTHVNFANFGDHTTGTGNMLVVNGAGTVNQSIWCQTVAVVPNMTYAFSAWLASVTLPSPAILDFTVNGVSLGSPLNASPVPGIWSHFTAVWNSGATTTATICIINLNTATTGNDFALDDIVFSPFCIYTDSATVTVNPIPAPDLGPDTAACAGGSIVLEPIWPGAQSFLWSDGSTDSALVATVSGTYWVDVTTNGCTGRDSIQVTINPLPVVNLGPDQDLCEGESTTLSAAQPGASYVWQDSSTGPTFTTDTSMTASVTVTILGCVASDTASITVFPLPVTDLGPDALTCPDSLLQFHEAQPHGSYLWDDGDTSPDHVISTEGAHWLTTTIHGCSTSDTMVVAHILLVDVELGQDFILCVGTTATLDAGVQPGPDLRYLWNNGSTGPTLEIDDGGPYSVLVTNRCSMESDSITVTKDQCNCPVFVPNAFTPDGDDVNDTFGPSFDCVTSAYHLMVFDRWGQMVWSSDDPNATWDGRVGGKAPVTGVYEWTLHVETRTVYDSFPRNFMGHVLVMP